MQEHQKHRLKKNKKKKQHETQQKVGTVQILRDKQNQNKNENPIIRTHREPLEKDTELEAAKRETRKLQSIQMLQEKHKQRFQEEEGKIKR